MLPEPTDTFAVLNHMFLTCPLNKELQEKLQKRKIRYYSYTRKEMNICNRKHEIMVTCMRKFRFLYKIFSEHHVIYPRMNISVHKSYLLDEVQIPITKEQLPLPCYLQGEHRWTNNYYHFITETLPSILFMNQHLYHYPILTQTAAFSEPLLRFFGVNNEVITDITDENAVLFQQDFIECGNPSPEKINILREWVESNVKFAPSVGILIYRKESTRSIVNHEEVLKTLCKLTPEMDWLVFDSESVETTVDMFRRAKVVVAPHGAGLTNMIFCKRGTPIIEFMPSQNPNICYWHLADVIGHQYNMIVADEVDGGKISVNMGEIEPILAKLLVVPEAESSLSSSM